MSSDEKNQAMRLRSGHVCSSDPLVGFFYDLALRVPVGKIEEAIRAAEDIAALDHTGVSYTNGWLAKYAEDLAERFRKAVAQKGGD